MTKTPPHSLKRDKHLGAFVRRHGPIVHRRAHARNTFQSLAESIVYQQLSGKAAANIVKRFVALFPGKKFPAPDDVLKINIKKLRSAGLSAQKASSIKDLATKCKDGTIEPKKFKGMSDAQIIEHVGRVDTHTCYISSLAPKRVYRAANLKVQVRAGRLACAAYGGDDSTLHNARPRRNIELARVGIERLRTVVVLYDEVVAVTAIPSAPAVGDNDRTCSGCKNVGTG